MTTYHFNNNKGVFDVMGSQWRISYGIRTITGENAYGSDIETFLHALRTAIINDMFSGKDCENARETVLSKGKGPWVLVQHD